MQAGRLIDFIRTFMQTDQPQATLPPTAHLLDLLNQAQHETSAELGVPVKLLTVTSEDSPFNLPADAQDVEPILEIRYAKDDGDTTLLPVVSLERAGLEYPNWEQDTSTADPEIAIYSAGVSGLSDVYVHPDPGSADYFILYKVKPADMADLNDEPFNGEFQRFHVMLAHYCVYFLNGNDQRFAIYRNFLRNIAGNRRRGPHVTPNLAYNMRGRFYGRPTFGSS